MGGMSLYGGLQKPPLAPPSWVFPAAWTVLYVLMGLAAYLVVRAHAPREEKKRALTAYAAQLVVNFIWPLLFFGAAQYLTAFFWLVLLLVLVTLTARYFGGIDKRAEWLLTPYLVWLLYAAYLNIGIYLLNR